MHDSFTPLGGLVPLFNIQLGEVVFGGVGAGLYGMLVYVVIAVFIAGLMVGRTPEYLGQEDRAVRDEDGLVRHPDPGVFHPRLLRLGVREQVGAAGRHRSADATARTTAARTASARSSTPTARPPATTAAPSPGISANTPWYNTTLAFAMLFGRFAMIIPILALAGSLARKKLVAESAGTFPVSGALFTASSSARSSWSARSTSCPRSSLGPVVEHFLMHAGKLF